jgi:hypothetical protein
MSTALVQYNPVSTLSDAEAIAKTLALSEYFDAKGNTPGNVAKIATKILAGREMGYGPFASAQGIHIIQGRPAIGANLMAAAVKASGRYDYRVRQMTADVCEIEFFERVDGKRESLGVSSFTAADAKAAGTQNMQKFARNMLFARAMSNGVKWFCPDVFNGNAVYVPEELGAEVDGDGNVIDTTARVIVEQPTTTQPEAPKPAADPFKAFMALGNDTFGADWQQARHWLIERYTTKHTPENIRRSAKELTPDELTAIRADMAKWNGRLVEMWQARRAELDAITVGDAVEDAAGIPA